MQDSYKWNEDPLTDPISLEIFQKPVSLVTKDDKGRIETTVITLDKASYDLLVQDAKKKGNQNPGVHFTYLGVDVVGCVWNTKMAKSVYRYADQFFQRAIRLVDSDPQKISYYLRAAALGHPKALYALGMRSEEGRGIEQDFVRAVNYFRCSAKKHYFPAQYQLGCLYRDGKGVDQNEAKAEKWFRRAAHQNHVASMRALKAMRAKNQFFKPASAVAPANRINVNNNNNEPVSRR